ncbi:hypothetical protein HMPREF9104_01372 [Lentilactobacillus kisonensis F0435]|uniref:Uncharacterized protein n=1 Tax=Lentilactobacillus kisonensis F0435 TaxID=797516 RepID=H1LFJ6_9LACO|nr:hypothetical protein HMPREF9104_01372 [Lentilactobacillus kisonensis F0435]
MLTLRFLSALLRSLRMIKVVYISRIPCPFAINGNPIMIC